MIEEGSFGRTLSLRLAPHEDLVTAIERACREAGIARAAIRSGLGSLVDARFEDPITGKVHVAEGPGAEILTLVGEIVPDADGVPVARLNGVVGAPDGSVAGGRFQRGGNLVCVTAEILLQEWLPIA